MKRVVPAPLLSCTLGVLWLVLQPSFGAANLATALVLALGVPLVVAPLRPTPATLRRPLQVARLVLVVGGDVIVSNVQVAAGVLAAGRRPLRPAFVTVPLELRDASALAALAVITTVVPGTVWCELAQDRGALRLHVFDVDDEATFVARYKARYERPLKEIFE
ncbi:MAG TPA: Na+/H+ antiporter subunit E [Casimicrobiaceae bacterium]|jgi:multicomponent K+:H+ antiporter subunit E|nr:Na+/H+ antiporter subunit E [Casimicrobiaceae bacterium]